MKLIRTEEAIGHVLCHDMTRIVRGVTKGPRFLKGHIVQEEDIPVLLSMGKENLYIYEMTEGMLHENEAADRLAALCGHEGMAWSETKEGKIELTAEYDGVFMVDSERLIDVNSVGQLIIASRRGNTAVHKGEKLCATRIIPLVIEEKILEEAERAAGDKPLFSLLPFKLKKAAILTTGNEVLKGRIKDEFTPVVKAKLKHYGIETVHNELTGDGVENVAEAIRRARDMGVDIILCTGGMSVDPDDNTPGAITASGADIVNYGTPVLPGAMFMLGYFGDVPVLGLPGCVMFAPHTVFDKVLPRIAAGVRLSRRDLVMMGEGGLCHGCPVCSFPRCQFA